MEIGSILLVIVTAMATYTLAQAASLSFKYESGATPADNAALRIHDADVTPVEGIVYAYASFGMTDRNPVDGDSGPQTVALGEMKDGAFTPAVQFGLANQVNRAGSQTFITPWATDGKLDHFGGYCRPKAICDLKLKLDLRRKRMTVWASQRGDDGWFILAEDVPLIGAGPTINHVKVKQHPGAMGVEGLRVQSKPWAGGEKVRRNALAKKNRVVKSRAGFKFQSIRSTWQIPGRHVTIQRNPPRWYGFPDVCQTGPASLVCCYNDGGGHGGGGGAFVKLSSDLGKTWGEQITVHPSGVNCPRVQKLRDGSLLLLADIHGGSYSVVMYDSHDGGTTWTNQRWLHPLDSGGTLSVVPSRVLEMTDGAWLLSASSYYPHKGEDWDEEWPESYLSQDKGRTWKLYSASKTYPPRTLSEPSTLILPDGRLWTVMRESRGDGWPASEAYSSDSGKTWDWRFLPYNIAGRVCSGFLKDGRAMVTFRNNGSGSALWAWIGSPSDTTEFRAAGAHFNDRHSVGLKGGALHIDSDGACGQFTRYILRPFYTPDTALDLTFEVKVLENAGRAATFSIPFTGKLRLYPDRAEFAHDPSLSFKVDPGVFHTYRVVSKKGTASIYVDGKLMLETDKLHPWPVRPFGMARNARVSGHNFSFGNELAWEKSGADPGCMNTYREVAPAEATGYSVWKRVDVLQQDPKFGESRMGWSAAKDGFPDQYQLDHIIEVEGSITGGDQGYSGWVQLQDGRIFVVNYTDDTAPAFDTWSGPAWIRGTYILPSDLPPVGGK